MSPASLPIPVYILHWNRPVECLHSIQSFLGQDLPVRIKVIDNASRPDLLETLTDGLPAEVELVRLRRNLGWGPGFNVVLTRWLEGKEGDYCFISAHDALPQPGCLRMLLETMQEDRKVGIASAEYGIAHLPTFSALRGARSPYVSPRPAGMVESVAFPHGTLMLFNRTCLNEIGLFDERYFAYGDEIELGLRARRHGWKVVFAWGARVVNPAKGIPTSTRSYLQSRNSLLMTRTYAGWRFAALRAVLMLPNTLRLAVFPSAQPSAFSPAARLAAIRDFFLGHFGPPPVAFTK